MPGTGSIHICAHGGVHIQTEAVLNALLLKAARATGPWAELSAPLRVALPDRITHWSILLGDSVRKTRVFRPFLQFKLKVTVPRVYLN